MVYAARDFFFCILSLVPKGKSTPIHRTIKSSTRQCPKRIFPQLHVQVRAELLDVNPSQFRGMDDAFRGLDCLVVSGLS